MARGIYGAGLQGMSGSLNKQAGGWTFGKNGLVRRRTTPTNPQTALQSLVRAAFSYLTTQWKSLTQAQRDAWVSAWNSNAYFEKQDPITGVSRRYGSAKDLFIGLNMNFLVSDGSLSTPAVNYLTPGTSTGTDAIGITSMVLDASAGSVTLTYTGTFTLEAAIIKMTPPVSAGNERLTSVRSKLRVVTNTPGASPAAISAAYIAAFGAITSSTGKKVFYTIEGVDLATGKARLIASGDTVIVA